MLHRVLSRLFGLIMAGSLLLPVAGVSAHLGGPDSYLLRNINERISAGSDPHWLMSAGDVTYFYLTDDVGMSELWKTNGTSDGTVLVKRWVEPPRFYSSTADAAEAGTFALYKGTFYFLTQVASNTPSLWRSDGTTDGTRQVLYNNLPITYPSHLLLFNDLLYLVSAGGSLFSIDGTGGVQLVTGLDQVYSDLVAFEGNLYYKAWREEHFLASVELASPAPSLSVSLSFIYDENLIVFHDQLFFMAQDASSEEGGHGYELWRMTGTGEAAMVADINVGGNSYPDDFMVYDDFLYFNANDGEGRKLWRTDGSEAGTTLVQDLYPYQDYMEYQLRGVVENTQGQAGKLIFATFSGDGNSLWATDGTPEGTIWLSNTAERDDFYSNILGNQLYYTGIDATHGVELWRTDGTTQGTHLFKDIWSGEQGSDLAALTTCGTRLCFVADDGVSGAELWSSNGNLTATTMVDDLNAEAADSSPWGFTNAEGQVFFLATDGVSGANLWRTDGTQAGTIALNDDPKVTFYERDYITHPGWKIVGSEIFMPVRDPNHGLELWRSDGTPEGTGMIKDIYPGNTDSTPRFLTVVGDRVYFVANNPQYEWELWVSDGSEAGTYLVKDIIPNGSTSKHYGYLSPGEGNLIFTMYDWDTNSNELWASNGSQEGTSSIKPFKEIGNFVTAQDGATYFIGRETAADSKKLYQTDGSADGTISVSSYDFLYSVVQLISSGNKIYILEDAGDGNYVLSVWSETDPEVRYLSTFHTQVVSYGQCVGIVGDIYCTLYQPGDPASGEYRIYKSDGTVDGTKQIVGDFSNSGVLFTREKWVVFSADTSAEGRQIWETDGTPEGTQQISHFSQPICGLFAEIPTALNVTYRGGQYILPLDDSGGTGCELWALDMRPPRAFLPVVSR